MTTRPRKAKAKLILTIIAVAGFLGMATPAVANGAATLGVVVIGAGSVSSRPAGISCPGTCVASFPAGTKVVLLPKANNGSTFLRWGGSCTGTGACDVDVTSLASVAAQFSAGKALAPAPAPSGHGFLTSGVPVRGNVRSAAGVTYKFVAVAGQHVTFAITNPMNLSAQLDIGVFDSSGAQVVGWTGFTTSPIHVDYTPSTAQGGLTKVVIIGDSNNGATGKFTLTYAKDVTGKLVSGIPRNIAIAYAGQNADYTFNAVTGHHVSFAITNPMNLSAQLDIGVFDSSGAQVVGWTGFTTSPIHVDYTPSTAQAGPTTVVIAGDSDNGATGSLDLTYATDVTGNLKSGVPVLVTIRFSGQNADYTFNAVAGRAASFAITKPMNLSAQLDIGVFDSSGAQVVGWTGFTTGPIEANYTPDGSQTGPTTVVIAGDSDNGATGSFTLTYTR